MRSKKRGLNLSSLIPDGMFSQKRSVEGNMRRRIFFALHDAGLKETIFSSNGDMFLHECTFELEEHFGGGASIFFSVAKCE